MSVIKDNHCFDTDLNTSSGFDGKRVRINVKDINITPYKRCYELKSILPLLILPFPPPLLCFVEEDIFTF